MRLKESKLFATIVCALTLLWNIYLFVSRKDFSLPNLLFIVAIIVFQLRTSLILLYYKRRQLSFHIFDRINWGVELDCLMTMVYVGLLPALLVGIQPFLVKDVSMIIYIVMYIIYFGATAMSILAETERFEWKKTDGELNYRLSGLWALSWNINYFADTLILGTLFYLATGQLLVMLIVIALLVVNIMQIQIPQNRTYIEQQYPDEAAQILEQKSFIPFLF